MTTAYRPADRILSKGADVPVRVLQVIQGLNYGGSERVVVDLALGVSPSRFETRVCCRDLGPLAERIRDHNIQVLQAGTAGRLQNYLRSWYVHKVISDFRPDVVHTHGLGALVEVGPLAAFGLVPHWVHTYHAGSYPNLGRRRYMYMERWFSGGPVQLVAVSNEQRENIIRYHRLHPNRLLTIENGVSPNAFVADGRTRARIRSELGFAASTTVVGTAAVLRPAKGMTYFLQAAEAIHQLRPDVRFLIVGGGPLEAELRTEAAQRKLEAVVTFTGWRSDIAEVLTALDTYVMSSLSEAMPLALLEAMAARQPIVATDVGQNAQIVRDGVDGLIVPPRDPQAIVDAVLQLLDDPSRATALAEAAFCRVEQKYTTARMIQQYESLYALATTGR